MMFLILLFALSSVGCATICRGTKDTLVVESDPAGANISLSNGMEGKTPASFKLSRKENLVVKIQKNGYEPVEVNVTSQVCGAGGAGMAGNVFVGGLIGAAVDAGSGAMYDLKPNPIKVTLAKNKNIEATSVQQSDVPLMTQRKKTIKERLDDIGHLLTEGVITPAEYESRRKKILDEL